MVIIIVMIPIVAPLVVVVIEQLVMTTLYRSIGVDATVKHMGSLSRHALSQGARTAMGSPIAEPGDCFAGYHPVMIDLSDSAIYLLKAEESLSGAESEYANRRYQNSANRAYYACYQAAVAALLQANIRPLGSRWGHDTVQAQFVGELLNRRKLYPSNLRDTFERLFVLRQTADYAADLVSEIQAARSLRRARDFVAAIKEARGN